jgi:5-oxoprolinase (ATP-hydrolysing)
MGKGDRLRIETPGGGGWGVPGEKDDLQGEGESEVKRWTARGSVAEREAAQAGF